MTEIERLAMLIALETAERRNGNTPSAMVPWPRIIELRAALNKAGLNYDAARQHMKADLARRKPAERIAFLRTTIESAAREIASAERNGFGEDDIVTYTNRTLAEWRAKLADDHAELAKLVANALCLAPDNCALETGGMIRAFCAKCQAIKSA